jgi:hypothetical protein
LHSIWPWGQPQTPPLQAWPVGQGLAQPPQLRGSLPVFTQAPLQVASPAEQVVAHAPMLQTWVAEHTVVQLPQCWGSEETHCPLQLSSPD